QSGVQRIGWFFTRHSSLATCPLAAQFFDRREGLRRNQGAVWRHGTGGDRFRQEFKCGSRRGGGDNGGLQQPAAHPTLTSLGDTVATRERNTQPPLAILLRQVDEGLSGAHGHGVVLADDPPNLELAPGPE